MPFLANQSCVNQMSARTWSRAITYMLPCAEHVSLGHHCWTASAHHTFSSTNFAFASNRLCDSIPWTQSTRDGRQWLGRWDFHFFLAVRIANCEIVVSKLNPTAALSHWPKKGLEPREVIMFLLEGFLWYNPWQFQVLKRLTDYLYHFKVRNVM